MSKWISVKDRLPENRGKYLVTIDCIFNKSIEVLRFSNDLYREDKTDFEHYKGRKKAGFYKYIFGEGCNECYDVTAWQPLPEPYEESEVKDD